MRAALSLTALIFLASACNPDDDGDGLTDKEELEIGSDPENPDTDGDTLGDFREVRELLTSPIEADSDCDGFDDPEELEFATDPLLPLEYPHFKKRWPDLSCHAPTEGLGFRPKQVIENMRMVDQFGTTVHLHQWYGHVILIDMSAGWCPPCREWAAAAQPLFEKFEDDGFIIIHSMVDDYTQDSTLTDDYFLETWADEYGLTFPVVNDERELADGFSGAGYNPDGGIPFLVLLNREMMVEADWVGYSEEQVDIVTQAVREAVKAPPPWE